MTSFWILWEIPQVNRETPDAERWPNFDNTIGTSNDGIGEILRIKCLSPKDVEVRYNFELDEIVWENWEVIVYGLLTTLPSINPELYAIWNNISWIDSSCRIMAAIEHYLVNKEQLSYQQIVWIIWELNNERQIPNSLGNLNYLTRKICINEIHEQQAKLEAEAWIEDPEDLQEYRDSISKNREEYSKKVMKGCEKVKKITLFASCILDVLIDQFMKEWALQVPNEDYQSLIKFMELLSVDADFLRYIHCTWGGNGDYKATLETRWINEVSWINKVNLARRIALEVYG